jgi:hypothetical protein
MAFELRYHGKAIPLAPRMQVSTAIAVATAPLDPKFTNLGNPLGGLPGCEVSGIVGAAPSGGGVIGPVVAWARERRGGRRIVIVKTTVTPL